MTGQFSMSLPLGRLRGENREALGTMIRAPVAWAAPAMPVMAKQLSGLLMGLSVTMTWAAPALKHRPATAARISGWVVAPREGGVAKAALTLMSTRSPFWTKDSMPPRAAIPRSNITLRSVPRTMAIFPGPEAMVLAVKSPRPVRALVVSDGAGPLESNRVRPKPPAARARAEAYPTLLRKSRRFRSPVGVSFSSAMLLHGFSLRAVFTAARR